MNTSEILGALDELDVELLKADGFDDCIIGVSYRASGNPIIAYDRGKCIEKLMRDGMTDEEAEEFFEFNVVGSWVGEVTPCFVDVLRTND